MHQPPKQIRILAVSLSSPGFGYAAIEGGKGLIDFGNMLFTTQKNSGSIAGIKRVIGRNHPDILVLQNVNAQGNRRRPRIKKLHQMVLALAKEQRLKVATISASKVRLVLLGNPNGTKYELAEFVAKRFPDEMTDRLPPKRKGWNSEDRRMDIFDAVVLVMAYCKTNSQT